MIEEKNTDGATVMDMENRERTRNLLCCWLEYLLQKYVLISTVIKETKVFPLHC